MTATFNFPVTKDPTTVGLNEGGDDQFWMVGALAQFTVIVFQVGGVKLLENIFVQIALMILAEQVKNIGWEQKSLVELNGAWFEWRSHGVIPIGILLILIIP